MRVLNAWFSVADHTDAGGNRREVNVSRFADSSKGDRTNPARGEKDRDMSIGKALLLTIFLPKGLHDLERAQRF